MLVIIRWEMHEMHGILFRFFGSKDLSHWTSGAPSLGTTGSGAHCTRRTTAGEEDRVEHIEVIEVILKQWIWPPPQKKTKMEPENWWFCRCFSFSKQLFSGSMLVFLGEYVICWILVTFCLLDGWICESLKKIEMFDLRDFEIEVDVSMLSVTLCKVYSEDCEDGMVPWFHKRLFLTLFTMSNEKNLVGWVT